MSQKTLCGPGGIRIELDKNRVVPDDPGADTPAMVYLGSDAATYWCASAEGEVDMTPLTQSQLDWLIRQEDIVEKFLYGASV